MALYVIIVVQWLRPPVAVACYGSVVRVKVSLPSCVSSGSGATICGLGA